MSTARVIVLIILAGIVFRCGVGYGREGRMTLEEARAFAADAVATEQQKARILARARRGGYYDE